MFQQYVLKCDIIVYLVCICIFLNGNFLISTIILLIFIRGVHVREKGGKERE